MALAIGWMEMLKGATGSSIHHTILLWPLPQVVIALSFEGGRFLGAGASTNAIEAGVQAYVNALNFLLEERPPS